jgi:uncharacterized protein (DUF58 family)
MNVMWFKTILRRANQPAAAEPLFDEAFLRRLERLSLQMQRAIRGRPIGGEHLSRHKLPAIIFSDHRPYSAGDDYRYIDWNAYAHQEEIFVKMGEVEQHVAVHVLLDISRSMHWDQSQKLRTAQRLGAAIGYLALTHNDRLRVTPFGSAITPRTFGPAQGKGRLVELLRFLQEQPADQQTAVGRVVADYARRHADLGGLAVICSDLLVPETLDEGLRLLTPPGWQTLVLHVLDPRELNPDLLGAIELEDAESGRRLLMTVDADIIQAYRLRVREWQEQIARTCARWGATYAPILTSWPMEQQVVPYLRVRRILE